MYTKFFDLKTIDARPSVLTIGVFDGIHLGHQKLFREIFDLSNENNFQSIVITFKNHPKEFLRPKEKFSILTDIEFRKKMIIDCGIENVLILEFNQALASLNFSDFIKKLKKELNLKALVAGKDFAMGKNRLGTVENIKKLESELEFDLYVVKPALIDGVVVKSSEIRKLLLEGNLKLANRYLNRYFTLSGKVVKGNERGRTLGFPTANLQVDAQQLIPKDAVYATKTKINDEIFLSATSIGSNPTFKDQSKSIETYLIDFHGDLYNKTIEIEFIKSIREQKIFSGATKLIKTMKEDILKIKNILKEKK